jgi:hypothetical protein
MKPSALQIRRRKEKRERRGQSRHLPNSGISGNGGAFEQINGRVGEEVVLLVLYAKFRVLLSSIWHSVKLTVAQSFCRSGLTPRQEATSRSS